jgi:Tfp pilus assembly protein PilO
LSTSHRQTVIRAFQIAGASLVLLDVLLYFGMLRSTQALVSSEQQQFAALRRRIHDGEVRIERLKKFREALPEAGKRLAALKRDHTPPRRQGFSQAAKLVRGVTGQSGTQLTSVAYKLDNNASGPLQRLGLAIVVAGPFPALLKFAHALETASDFIVIRSFNIAASDTHALELRLSADLYLTP